MKLRHCLLYLFSVYCHDVLFFLKINSSSAFPDLCLIPLFLSLFVVSIQGNRMLTVKGTGGDSGKASASSFATSAAAFGAVPGVTMLRGVGNDGTCEWDQRISFA
jgi:hypothetical protein